MISREIEYSNHLVMTELDVKLLFHYPNGESLNNQNIFDGTSGDNYKNITSEEAHNVIKYFDVYSI